jgi:methionine-rich copper-binding protein CopC
MNRSPWTILIALWCLMLAAGDPALAHTDLVGSDPPRGATLDRTPDGVRLEFSEPVEAPFDPVEVYDGEGNRVDLGNGRVITGDPRVVTVGLAGLGGGETYRVEYRVIAEDGDPTEGAYTFTLANGARPAEGGGKQNAAPAGGGAAAGGPSRLPLYAGIGIAGILAVALVSYRRGGGAK